MRFVLNDRSDLILFPDQDFDLVFSTLVLQHMPPACALQYIREFIRVVQPGGVVAFSAPSGFVSRAVAVGWGIRQTIRRCVPTAVLLAYRRHRDGIAHDIQMFNVPEKATRDAVAVAGGRMVSVDRTPDRVWFSCWYYVIRA
jgi:ubiquinone/menaquinone biosynthesis C-methylase UbiE